MNNGNKMLKTGPRFENGGRFSLPKKPRRVRGPQAANSVPSIFRGGVYVAKNTLRGESVLSRILCVKTRGSERKLFCQKRAPPFFDKLKNRSAPADLFFCEKPAPCLHFRKAGGDIFTQMSALSARRAPGSWPAAASDPQRSPAFSPGPAAGLPDDTGPSSACRPFQRTARAPG